MTCGGLAIALDDSVLVPEELDAKLKDGVDMHGPSLDAVVSVVRREIGIGTGLWTIVGDAASCRCTDWDAELTSCEGRDGSGVWLRIAK